MNVEQQVRTALDGTAAAAVITSITGWLPPIAAALGIIWYLIQIAESKTGQRVIAGIRLHLRRILSRPPEPPPPA